MEFWRKLKFRWDSNVTTVLDDFTARSAQELTVSKGQHVRVVQKCLPNAPDWCLIRLLNDHHHQPLPPLQQHQSSPSSLAASSTTIPNTFADPPVSISSKYTEGLVPAVILKATKSSSANVRLPPPLTLPTNSGKSEPDTNCSTIDELQPRPSPSVFCASKRKSSFRRILKNPVRRLSLKDNSTSSNTNKDIKTTLPVGCLATSTSILSANGSDGISINKQDSLSSNSTASTRIKAFTFTNFDDLTSLPDDTTSTSKSADNNGSLSGIYKMTESLTSSVTTIISPVRDNLPQEVSELSPTFDIQSRILLSTETNNDTSSIAPINIVAGLTASDFHIPVALTITTPSINDTSTTACTPSSSLITMIPSESQNEPTDEVALNDTDTTTLTSITTTITDEPIDDRTKYGGKRRHNVMELIETEKEYVKDLALIVEGYMNVIENDKELKKPTGLTGRERVVFGNVQRIYEFHRDTFLPQLEQCIENPDILGRLFTTNRFSPYVRYCENKPRSEYIVSEYHDYFEEIRKKLGQKLLVSDLLIKPVQRIMRYQLLLREILRSTERMGDESRAIRGALQVMIEVPQQANDMMNVGRIKDLPTNVHQLGELKLQDMLSVSEPISKETKDVKEVEKKFKERRAFLFQQAMIFCDEIPAKDKYSSPNYIYKYELKINKLQHKEFKQNKELFQITLVELDAGNTRRVICQCKDDEQYELWVTSVSKVLQRQMDLITALINPTAALQKELLTWEIPEWRQAGRRRFTASGTAPVTVSSHSNL